MKQAILACIGMAFLGSTLPAQAAPPKQLLGRSVTVNWTETRSQRHVGETEFRNVNANHTLMVYVSSAGRVFSRQVNNITQVGSGQINQLGAAREGSYAVATPSFSGQAMTIVRVGQGGARRVAVAFDAGFSSCSATAGTGFEAGKTYTSYSPITKKMSRSALPALARSAARYEMATCLVTDAIRPPGAMTGTSRPPSCWRKYPEASGQLENQRNASFREL